MWSVVTKWWCAAAVAAAMVFAACGGDDDNDNAQEPSSGSTSTPAESATRPPRTTSTLTPAERAAALCSSAAQPVTVTVQSRELVEASGIVASRAHDGVLWTHNDSGDTARVIAIARDGTARGVFDLAGADAIDWEDMAIGPGPLGVADHLYMGDIGDNAAERSEIVVYRIAEPDLDIARASPALDGAERITLRYADGPHDAETLLVDPISGHLVIVTKEIVAGDSGVYVASAEALATGSSTLERAGTIAKTTLTSTKTPPDDASALVRGVGWLPTGGEISPDGALIAIRTYASVFIWPRQDGQTVAEALAGAPCEAPSAIETQGEAIAFTPDGGGYYTVSEGANPTLYRFGGE
jgi:hypothetical protein